MRATLLALLMLAAVPASAVAGGFATVGLSSTPDGTAAGELWDVELTILAHGRSEAPWNGLRPTVIVLGPGGERRTFAGSPAGRPGIYRARVVFPSDGIWRYSVNDGFAGTLHHFRPVQIGPGAAAEVSAGGPNIGLALLVAAVAALGAGLTTRLLRLGRPAEAW